MQIRSKYTILTGKYLSKVVNNRILKIVGKFKAVAQF